MYNISTLYYWIGHFEHVPYDEDTKRSVYHIRNVDVFKLKQLKQPLDIMLSHDWPNGVYHCGNVSQLLRHKPFFKGQLLIVCVLCLILLLLIANILAL